MPRKLEEILEGDDCENIRRICRLFRGQVVAILKRPIDTYDGVAYNTEIREEDKL